MEIQDFPIAKTRTVLANNKFASERDVRNETATEEEIQAWIVFYLANLLEMDPDEIDVKTPFDRYGMDSSAAVGMTGDLEDWLGRELEPTLMYDYPTIEILAQNLAEDFKVAA